MKAGFRSPSGPVGENYDRAYGALGLSLIGISFLLIAGSCAALSIESPATRLNRRRTDVSGIVPIGRVQRQTNRIGDQATEDAPGWQLESLVREPSIGLQLYMLTLLIVCIATSVRLIRIWVAVPPFTSSSRADKPSYLGLLTRSTRSLKQWIYVVFLGYGLLFSTSLYGVCKSLLRQDQWGSAVILFIIKDYATTLSLALCVVIFVVLVRWHALKRVERLDG